MHVSRLYSFYNTLKIFNNTFYVHESGLNFYSQILEQLVAKEFLIKFLDYSIDQSLQQLIALARDHYKWILVIKIRSNYGHTSFQHNTRIVL